MAIKIWDGSTDGDVSVAANWTPAVVPVNGDSIVFNGDETNEVDTNMNALAAVNIDQFIVTTDYEPATFGTVANPFEVNDCALFLYSGKVTASYVKFNGTCDIAHVIDTGTGADALHLDGGIISLLYLFAGTVTLDAGLTIDDIYSHYRVSASTDVLLTIAAGVFLTNLSQSGGAITCSSDIGVCIKTGGSLTMSAGDIGQLFNGGGRVAWNASGGTIGRADIRGGELTGAGDPTTKTITDLYCWYGARTDLRNHAANIVITNPVEALGGVVYTEPGASVTFA